VEGRGSRKRETARSVKSDYHDGGEVGKDAEMRQRLKYREKKGGVVGGKGEGLSDSILRGKEQTVRT